MTESEARALELTVDLWLTLLDVVGDGDTRDADLAELAAHVHAIQRAVLAQDTVRASGGQFRLLGGTFIP